MRLNQSQFAVSRQPFEAPSVDCFINAIFVNCVFLAVFASAIAFSGACLFGQAPTTVPPGVSGYTVSYSSQSAVSPNGYRTFWVTIETNPKKPVAEDQQFTVVIKDRVYNKPGKVVSAEMMIKAGKTSAKVEMYLACPDYYSNLDLMVERGQGNGRFDRGRDIFYTNVNSNVFRRATSQPNLLLISSQVAGQNTMSHVCYKRKVGVGIATQISVGAKVPALSGLVDVYQSAGGAATPIVAGIPTFGTSEINYCRPQDIPNAWIGLTAFDLVMISFSDLSNICAANEVKRATLKKWVAAGGALIVFDSGPDFKEVDRILPTLIGKLQMSERGPLKQVWSQPAKALQAVDQLVRDPNQNSSNYYYNEDTFVDFEQTELSEDNLFVTRDDDELDTNIGFCFSRFVNGQIVCVNDDMAKWDQPSWISLLNAINLDSAPLENKIGTGNPSYGLAYFAIPGVGEPPVIAFQILMSLFVIVAGPIMYVVLRRSKQLQLLFILVPTMSLTACLGLLSYAVFVDGFDSWGIAQSVTFLDQDTQSAVTHARAAYFSGTQPRPYQFLPDTVPIAPVYSHSNPERTRKLEEGLEVSGGDIKARSPHQVVSVRSHEADQRLLVLPALKQRGANGEAAGSKTADDEAASNKLASSAGAPTHSMRNLLGADIKFAAAMTDKGLVLIENLAEGEQKNGRKISGGELDGLLKGFIVEFSKSTSSNVSRYRANAWNRNSDGYYWGEENRIVQMINSTEASKLLENENTYLAILEEFPVTAAQIEKVKFKKQLHIVIGKWSPRAKR